MFKSIIEWLKNNQKNTPIDGQGRRPEGKRPTPESLAKTRKFHSVSCGYQPEKEKVADNEKLDQRKKFVDLVEKFNPTESPFIKTLGLPLCSGEYEDGIFGVSQIKPGYYIECLDGSLWKVLKNYRVYIDNPFIIKTKVSNFHVPSYIKKGTFSDNGGCLGKWEFGNIERVYDENQVLIAMGEIEKIMSIKENSDALHQSIEELNKGRSVEVDIPNSAEKLKVDVRPILQPDQDKEIEIKSEWRPVVKLDAKRKMQQIPSAPFLDGYFAPLHFKNPYDANLQGFSYRQYEGGKTLRDKVLGHIDDSVEVFQGMTAEQVRVRFLEIKNQAFGVPE